MPLGAGTGTLASASGLRAILRRIAHAHREALAPFDGQHQVRFAHRRLKDVLDRADGDPIACCRLTIDPYIEIRRAR